MTDEQTRHNVRRIQQLNDELRTTLSGGTVVVTRGIQALDPNLHTEVLKRVVLFDEFSEANDPYGEHDLGVFEYAGHRIMWKIDCYDRDQRYASPDPSDPTVTSRVLTIMLSSEY